MLLILGILVLIPVIAVASGTVLTPPVTVTENTGPVFTATDTGVGSAIVGLVGNTAGAVGIFVKSTSPTNRAITVMGQATGPSSIGVVGQTFSTDTNNPSIGAPEPPKQR